MKCYMLHVFEYKKFYLAKHGGTSELFELPTLYLDNLDSSERSFTVLPVELDRARLLGMLKVG